MHIFHVSQRYSLVSQRYWTCSWLTIELEVIDVGKDKTVEKNEG